MSERMEDLISIIVPVYNVELYLSRCLDSLAKQSYPFLDIILVDDGSEDHSGEICDLYQDKDSRFRVFHKKNGGLSDARNLGMEKIRGRYVTFVDSDDYVAETYIEFLYRLLLNENADIAICGYHETTQEEQKVRHSSYKEVTDGKTAVKKMLYQKKITTSACAKMYKVPLLRQISFPYSRLYEDVNTIYKIVLRAEKVVYSAQIEYFYFVRPRSIVHSGFNKKKMDYITNTWEVMEDMKKNNPELYPAAVSRYLWANLHILVHLPKAGYIDEREQVINNIKYYRRQVLRDPQVRIKNKILLLACFKRGTLIRWVFHAAKNMK